MEESYSRRGMANVRARANSANGARDTRKELPWISRWYSEDRKNGADNAAIWRATRQGFPQVPYQPLSRLVSGDTMRAAIKLALSSIGTCSFHVRRHPSSRCREVKGGGWKVVSYELAIRRLSSVVFPAQIGFPLWESKRRGGKKDERQIAAMSACLLSLSLSLSFFCTFLLLAMRLISQIE